MVKEKKEEVVMNWVKIGEIEVGSQTSSVMDLAKVGVSLLETKIVKEYLEVLKKRKSGGSYLG